MKGIFDDINTAFTNYNTIVAGTDNSFEAIEFADDDAVNDYVSSSSYVEDGMLCMAFGFD
jgi:hypothetical protein